jgi:flavin reductase (DIM6/NTAB) family NADH-FMN oxidoreductase RutF
LTADHFRHLMSHFATGITVVTVIGKNGAVYGVTVNSFTSVSLEPLLVLVCLDNRLSGFGYFQPGKVIGISVLAEDQEEVSRYFAQRGLDRSEADYLEGTTGVPLIRGAIATLECLIVEAHAAGDHAIFVAEVKAGQVPLAAAEKGPLLYYRSRYTRLT